MHTITLIILLYTNPSMTNGRHQRKRGIPMVGVVVVVVVVEYNELKKSGKAA